MLIELRIAGFILPRALALSIRDLSLFMRLAFPPQRKLPPTLLSYVIGLVLQVLFVLERAFDLSPDILSSSALFNPDIERHARELGHAYTSYSAKRGTSRAEIFPLILVPFAVNLSRSTMPR